ncbi:MAG: glycosyltransferase family 39 protein [Burkholderiaceae bacterium]
MALQWLLGNLSGLRMDGGYPYGLQHFDTIFMHVALITRLVSVAMALGMVYWVYRIGRALHSHLAGFFAACILGFSPAIVYYVHVETLDVPMMFWLSAALYCYIRVLQTFGLRHYINLAILAAISTATKDYAYGAFVLLPFYLVAALARHNSGEVTAASFARAALDRRHFIALGVFVVSFAIAENWIWNFSGFVNHVKVAGGFAPESANVITTSFGRFDLLSPQRLASMARILVFVLGWVGFAAGILGVLYAGLRERRILVILGWPAISYYVFTVCQVLPSDSEIERPYLPLGEILAIFGGLMLARAATALPRMRRVILFGAFVPISLNGIAMDIALVTDPRYQAEKWLNTNAANGARIELFGWRSELPRKSASLKMVIYNGAAPPLSDVQLTKELVTPQALTDRVPDWIVVSWAFLRDYSAEQGDAEQRALHAFLQELRDGNLGYVEKASFASMVPNALGFPPRLAPRVTIFGKR